ncbi:cell division protein FtsQ/DivIB [Coralloluteibacterium thermophilus]|uniref:Cell division protein FtsQ n=1 Tax=Coralloluteibacterium thermophilum TaxID=2707049 RepID=A0ABV9NQC3_9GAMM
MTALVRILAWTIALALVALPVVAVLNGWVAGDRWPMRRLLVTAEFGRVSDEQVRAAVLPHARSGFFAVEPAAVRAAVAALPWVETVEVRKRWPDVLEVAISEHRPFARWGEEQLLSEQGRLFSTPGETPIPEGLPQLFGPQSRISDVVALYRSAQPLFAVSGRRVEGVLLSPRGSWTLTLDTGTEVVLGRTDPQPRMERFARLLPHVIAAEQRPLLRADLRYTNGFALVWGEPDPEAPAAGRAPLRSTPMSRVAAAAARVTSMQAQART